ncbi:uncharacterized protein TM35_000033800 [Trypanosoma theileri]|uniref:Uncharacterized protein n=1 Tax=Trypanosoma theileri TaxID=67003 RepID=A0A1X0P6R7_9TRYP|nr:uncharacterized protein TM35_000033800 [Trypanosoma theileri]ORC92627.1 hypothetical protein TM35_000033800 [Trypanosoma theileri]
MNVVPLDPRSEFRRRLRNVIDIIDESLLLKRRGMNVKPFSRAQSESPHLKDSSRIVPCISAWSELRTEQRREELHKQREEAEELLRTLKHAQERRKLQRNVLTEINTSSSTMLRSPSRLDETVEKEEQTEVRKLFSNRQPPLSPPSPPIVPSAPPDVEEKHEAKNSKELLRSDESILQVALVEEATRQRLAERRAAEEESLAKLRALRREVMKKRQEALAHAEAQIEQAESERIAKVKQLEQETRRSVAEEEKRCTITEVELRAMEVHANALAQLRSQTEFALPSSVLPVRPPPTPPSLVHPQMDVVSFPSHYSSNYSSLPHNTAQNYNYHNSSAQVAAVRGVGSIVSGSLSPERTGKVMTTMHSTPTHHSSSPSTLQRNITTGSAGKLAETLQSSSHTPHNSGKVKEGKIKPERLFISPKRHLDEEVPLESPPRLSSSSSSTINVTATPSPSSSSTLIPEKEDTPQHSLSPTFKPQVREILSPTPISHNDSVKMNTSEILVSRSGSFATLHGCGIVAYVLTSEVGVIPVLLRLSADSQELLLHIGPVKRDSSPSKSSTKSSVKESKQRIFSPVHHQEQNREYESEMGCSMRRVEEVHHFALLRSCCLCPFGSIGADSSREVGGVLCGSIARRLLRKLYCTFFTQLGESSYRVFLVSFNASHHAKGESTRSPRVINPNTSTLLVLQFRNRQDWAAFLMSAGEATRSLNGGVPLTYGRALWILAAYLWQRRRSCTSSSSLSPIRRESVDSTSKIPGMKCVKHFRMVPQSILSFSSNTGIESSHSQHIVSGNRREHEGKRISTPRFIIPPQRSNSSIKKNNTRNKTSNDVVEPHLRRGRRFGLRTTTNSILTSSPPRSNPANLMRYNY